MAETEKKAKAPAKPRAAAVTKKATTKKKADGAAKVPSVPPHEEIALLALQYWEQRGGAHGQHEQDWLRAEQALMKLAS